jgi:hypothetical protein
VKNVVVGKRRPAPSIVPQMRRSTAAASDAERRQLTIMFCDMVASSTLSTQLDPEFWTRRARPVAIPNSLSTWVADVLDRPNMKTVEQRHAARPELNTLLN